MLAFHADMSDDGRRLAVILEREGSLYSPTCIETVVKPPSYLAGLKTASGASAKSGSGNWAATAEVHLGSIKQSDARGPFGPTPPSKKPFSSQLGTTVA